MRMLALLIQGSLESLAPFPFFWLSLGSFLAPPPSFAKNERGAPPSSPRGRTPFALVEAVFNECEPFFFLRPLLLLTIFLPSFFFWRRLSCRTFFKRKEFESGGVDQRFFMRGFSFFFFLKRGRKCALSFFLWGWTAFFS